jgi:hypothetical protein
MEVLIVVLAVVAVVWFFSKKKDKPHVPQGKGTKGDVDFHEK